MLDESQVRKLREELEAQTKSAADAGDYTSWCCDVSAVAALDRVLSDYEIPGARERIPFPASSVSAASGDSRDT